MTPNEDAEAVPSNRSILDGCETFPDALVALLRRRQSSGREKVEDILRSIPLTVRNWRRITKGEVIPGVNTFYNLRSALCHAADFDKFDEMYFTASLKKERFSEEDVLGLIELASGVKCSKADLLDPKCFRAITFSPKTALDSAASVEKAISYFKALRSLLISGRVPARSPVDRQFRITITLFREALAARVANRLNHQRGMIASIASIGLQEQSAFVRGALIDLELLASNSPEDVFFLQFDKPLVDAYVKGFQKVLAPLRRSVANSAERRGQLCGETGCRVVNSAERLAKYLNYKL